MKKITFTALVVLFAATAGLAQEAKPKQFLIVLRLTPTYHDLKNWTDKENRIVGEHFRKLQELQKAGKLILAGRTTVEESRTMGLIVFEAASEEEARGVMNADPAVANGIMTAELFPYAVALYKKP